MNSKARGLGRGLDALLGTGNKGAKVEDPAPGDVLRSLPIEQIQAGRYQPRQVFDGDKLDELAESIRAQGVIQPILVRTIAKDRYEIIAGERRWRAAARAGLAEVPVVLRKVDDRAVIAMALIENIQREDLNPLEEAQALARLIDEFALTHQQAAEAVGRSRAAVSNLLRLLELPEPIRLLLAEQRLEMGHARALLTLAPQTAVALAQQAAAEGWSVREVERRAHELAAGKLPETKPGKKPALKRDADVVQLERELGERLGTRVELQPGRGGKGKLVLHYHGHDTLDGLLDRLRGPQH
ncbi:ParB/RepB/Spo0J family partition protein [Silanimonas sp.]|uniref:ParB/RepB/Spo0J family partition protein n=1 Tax=Silanimonas sp. TaxID=1929290 RepID=UPI001BC5AC62|nr:ParB/RepB/Spo0J family partition protein [Silanimonas sp.]MBS3895950.1 ParB/RepB/Spo0J family partition protein [Silanimonas sp.]MBS3924271.1 ParB/RepB/Spo0J family partition protein [Xanthomonadaceae bacterium]